jgi:DNA-binding NarL/FixJ family response regulator
MSVPLRKVVIVDDHEIFRAGLRAGLGPTVQVVGEAGTVEEAVPLIRAQDPDVVLLDVHLPDGGGHAVIAPVHAERPGVRFRALSVSDAPEDVLATIRAGARGYTYKEIASRLHLSVKTIETHVSSVLRKLQLSNRNELTRWAAQRRMI